MSMEDLLRRTLGEHITVHLDLDTGLWLTLCDENQLESAILNLVINARDAMPDGGALTITTRNSSLVAGTLSHDVPSGDFVCITVTDTGVGMSPATIDRAFEPFYTTKPMGQGTGLGLSMIYGFVRQSEGVARIVSELGQGSTIRLYLPRHHAEAPMVESPATGGLEHHGDSGKVVLVVEDEPVVRNLVVEVLDELGYTTLEAGDGQAGLDLLQSHQRIDLLITDNRFAPDQRPPDGGRGDSHPREPQSAVHDRLRRERRRTGGLPRAEHADDHQAVRLRTPRLARAPDAGRLNKGVRTKGVRVLL